MDLNSGVSLGTLLLTLVGVIASGGIAWGSLLQRVKTLEREVQTLTGFAERLARIEEQTKAAAAALQQLTGSWLFQTPPGYDTLERPIGPRGGKRP